MTDNTEQRLAALEQLFIDHAHNNTPQVGGQISYNDLDSNPDLTNLPSDDEKDALAGSSGTPSSSNTYLTEDDATVAATADKVARRGDVGQITVPTTPVASTDAASMNYVNTVNLYASSSTSTKFSDDTETLINSATSLFKYAQVRLPGIIKLATSFKVTAGTGSIFFWVASSNKDGLAVVSETTDVLFYENLSFSSTSYSNISQDVRVKAGDIVGMSGLGDGGALYNTNFRIQFDTNVETSVYGEVLS